MENLNEELSKIYDSYDNKEENVEENKNENSTENNKDIEQKPVEENNKIVEEDNKTIQPNENIKQDNAPINSIELPRGVKTSFNDSWKGLNSEFQKELKRSFEVKDNYIKNLEERNNNLNKAINTAEIEIQNVMKQTNLPREQVIGNMLSWVSACQIDPDNTLCNALQQGAIQLKNPEGFIRFIANQYRLNLGDLSNIDPRQASLYDENARLRMQNEAFLRQKEYQKQIQELTENEKANSSVENFKNNHAEISDEVFNSSVFQNHMVYAIEKIKSQEPNNNNNQDILEKAYKLIEKDYNNNVTIQENQENIVNQNQENFLKKPVNKITTTTGIKSSTPTSRTIKKSYENDKEMEKDLRKELSYIYDNY